MFYGAGVVHLTSKGGGNWFAKRRFQFSSVVLYGMDGTDCFKLLSCFPSMDFLIISQKFRN
jgi:hypothetical protein